MQVWNVLRAARWKYRTQKNRQKSPSGYHRTNLSGCIFATKAHIDNRKKMLSSNNFSTVPPQYGELRPTSGWDRSGSLRHIFPHIFAWTYLRHPCKFQRVSHLGSVTARHYGSRRQPNFAALNRGRHLYSAGRPSRWALAHVSSSFRLSFFSSPNLSRRRLDVYHTSTHGVALARI